MQVVQRCPAVPGRRAGGVEVGSVAPEEVSDPDLPEFLDVGPVDRQVVVGGEDGVVAVQSLGNLRVRARGEAVPLDVDVADGFEQGVSYLGVEVVDVTCVAPEDVCDKVCVVYGPQDLLEVRCGEGVEDVVRFSGKGGFVAQGVVTEARPEVDGVAVAEEEGSPCSGWQVIEGGQVGVVGVSPLSAVTGET